MVARALERKPVLAGAVAPAVAARHKWSVLAVVAVATFMTTLDASIVNIGLPSIARSFNTPLNGALEWIIIGYLVVIAGSLLAFGRLSDLIGRKPLWLAGLCVFTLGSMLCGAAPALEWLIAARIFQAVGSSLIFAPSIAIITDTFPPEERGRALGFNAIALALGASAGPTIGGLITAHFTWRWIFFVNAPIGLLCLLASSRLLSGSRGRAHGRFDLLGAFLPGVGLAGITLALTFGPEWGWTSVGVLAAAGTGLAALGVTPLVERRVRDPAIDLDLLRNRIFASASLSLVLSMLALFAVSFLLPFYLEELRGFSTAQSGLLLTPFPLTIAVVAPIAGSLADRMGSRWLAPLGLGVSCVGLLLLTGLDATSATWDIAWRLAVIGVGQGLFLSPNTRALLGAAPASEQGQASSLLATERVVGQSLSVAVAGAVFASLGGTAAGSLLAAQRAGQTLSAAELSAAQATFLYGYHAALVVSAAVAAIGIFAALVRGNGEMRSA